jgi:hypothetical protein
MKARGWGSDVEDTLIRDMFRSRPIPLATFCCCTAIHATDSLWLTGAWLGGSVHTHDIALQNSAALSASTPVTLFFLFSFNDFRTQAFWAFMEPQVAQGVRQGC